MCFGHRTAYECPSVRFKQFLKMLSSVRAPPRPAPLVGIHTADSAFRQEGSNVRSPPKSVSRQWMVHLVGLHDIVWTLNFVWRSHPAAVYGFRVIPWTLTCPAQMKLLQRRETTRNTEMKFQLKIMLQILWITTQHHESLDSGFQVGARKHCR